MVRHAINIPPSLAQAIDELIGLGLTSAVSRDAFARQWIDVGVSICRLGKAAEVLLRSSDSA